MFTKLVERFRSRVLVAPAVISTKAEGYALPTPGVMGITLRAICNRASSKDVTVTLKTATDAAGTSAADYPVDVPIYLDGVRKDNGKSITTPTTDGKYIVDICIDPATIPDGAFIGLHCAAASASSVAVEMIEDVAYKPTPA